MPMEHGPVTSSGKSAPGSDPRIRNRIQIGIFRPIRVDHTNCLQVAIKTHSSSETDQTDRQTEAKTDMRRGSGREEDIMRKREPETENLAETAKVIETGHVAATETNSTHKRSGAASNSTLS